MDNKRKGLLITGTGFDVGSTTVTAALTRYCLLRDINTAVHIPIETGVGNTQELGQDAQLLKWAAGSNQERDVINPYRFESDSLPAFAATQDGTRIDFNNLVATFSRTIDQHEFTLIDGSGGLMVPLAGGMLMGDLAGFLKLPVVICCLPHKDTINQVMANLTVARQMNLEVAGYFINSGRDDIQFAEQDKLPHALATLTTEELLGVLPRFSGDRQKRVEETTAFLTEMKTLPFLKPYLPE